VGALGVRRWVAVGAEVRLSDGERAATVDMSVARRVLLRSRQFGCQQRSIVRWRLDSKESVCWCILIAVFLVAETNRRFRGCNRYRREVAQFGTEPSDEVPEAFT
jgi:hypothetical protein